MKLSTLLWVIVPGVGQIRLGRSGRGILLFTLFALLLNAWAVCPLLLPDRVVRTTLLALTVLAWLISTVDYLRASAEEEMTDDEVPAPQEPPVRTPESRPAEQNR